MPAADLKPCRIAPSTKSVLTEPYTAALPSNGYVRLPIASAVCGIAKSTIWAWSALERFPKPVKLSPRFSACPATDVHAWLADPAAWQVAQTVVV